jgi:hypothetical protein
MTEETARTRLGILRLTRGGKAITNRNRVLAKFVHERFSAHALPRSRAYWMRCAKRSWTEHLRAAYTPRAKAAAGAALAKVTHDRPPGLDA